MFALLRFFSDSVLDLQDRELAALCSNNRSSCPSLFQSTGGNDHSTNSAHVRLDKEVVNRSNMLSASSKSDGVRVSPSPGPSSLPFSSLANKGTPLRPEPDQDNSIDTTTGQARPVGPGKPPLWFSRESLTSDTDRPTKHAPFQFNVAKLYDIEARSALEWPSIVEEVITRYPKASTSEEAKTDSETESMWIRGWVGTYDELVSPPESPPESHPVVGMVETSVKTKSPEGAKQARTKTEIRVPTVIKKARTKARMRLSTVARKARTKAEIELSPVVEEAETSIETESPTREGSVGTCNETELPRIVGRFMTNEEMESRWIAKKAQTSKEEKSPPVGRMPETDEEGRELPFPMDPIPISFTPSDLFLDGASTSSIESDSERPSSQTSTEGEVPSRNELEERIRVILLGKKSANEHRLQETSERSTLSPFLVNTEQVEPTPSEFRRLGHWRSQLGKDYADVDNNLLKFQLSRGILQEIEKHRILTNLILSIPVVRRYNKANVATESIEALAKRDLDDVKQGRKSKAEAFDPTGYVDWKPVLYPKCLPSVVEPESYVGVDNFYDRLLELGFIMRT